MNEEELSELKETYLRKRIENDALEQMSSQEREEESIQKREWREEGRPERMESLLNRIAISLGNIDKKLNLILAKNGPLSIDRADESVKKLAFQIHEDVSAFNYVSNEVKEEERKENLDWLVDASSILDIDRDKALPFWGGKFKLKDWDKVKPTYFDFAKRVKELGWGPKNNGDRYDLMRSIVKRIIGTGSPAVTESDWEFLRIRDNVKARRCVMGLRMWHGLRREFEDWGVDKAKGAENEDPQKK